MRRALILTGVTLAILLAACADGGGEPAPTATLEPAATATTEARRTGISQVDAVLDVLFSGDADAVRAMVRFTAIPCEAEPVGLGSPPMCKADESDGSPVDVYPHSSCEGFYIRPENMDGSYSSLASPDGTLYAVYRAPDRYWPPAQFVAIFTDPSRVIVPGDAQAVSITDGRIVGSHSGCASTPEEFIAFHRLEDSVLFIGSGGLTGISGLDTALDALRLADVETLDRLIQFQPIRCIVTPRGIGAPPLCRPDEPDGTILAVLPVSTCELTYVREDESDWVPGSLAEGQLYAVYQDGDRYVAVLSYEMPDGQRATRVFIDGRRIVEIDVTCVLTPEEALAGIDPADILVAPVTFSGP
ncbi:MAG: hypothetical protein IIC90_01605 [Chloroflexi bacterium]|nr:hypothetical protein [Chloroflexota bacterium]